MRARQLSNLVCEKDTLRTFRARCAQSKTSLCFFRGRRQGAHALSNPPTPRHEGPRRAGRPERGEGRSKLVVEQLVENSSRIHSRRGRGQVCIKIRILECFIFFIFDFFHFFDFFIFDVLCFSFFSYFYFSFFSFF